MKAGLFIPCYVDAFFPAVGIATLQLLERLGVEVVYPLDQTCCGQMMANSGSQKDAAGAEALFVENFKDFDHIVTPSGSCAYHVREHLDAIPQTADAQKVRRNTYELVEFLHDVLMVQAFPWAEFPHRVGLHNSCTTLRQLRTAKHPRLTNRSSQSRSICSARSAASSSWRRADRTNAVASAALFPFLRSRSPPRWVTTRSRIITTPAPSTLSRPTCRASCIRRAAPSGSGWTSALYISPKS